MLDQLLKKEKLFFHLNLAIRKKGRIFIIRKTFLKLYKYMHLW